MKLQNDEMIIWKQRSHMMLKGEVVIGEVAITTRRMVFLQYDDPRILRKEKTERDVWELDIDRIKDINLYQVNGRDFPYIRVHYKENDVYLTFPDSDPRSTVAAMIIFVNHAWTISKMVTNIKNIERSLMSGTLNMGEDLPKFVTDLPRKADEECHQCGKSLIEDELDMIAQDVRECLSCAPEMH